MGNSEPLLLLLYAYLLSVHTFACFCQSQNFSFFVGRCTQHTVTYSKSINGTLEKRCWICSKFTSSWVSVTEIFHKALVNTNYGKLTRINFKSTHSSQVELSQKNTSKESKTLQWRLKNVKDFCLLYQKLQLQTWEADGSDGLL